MILAAQHKINIPVKKVLIIQLGDIGDVVWAIPSFWTVKKKWPQTAVSILTREPNGDLLKPDPQIDKVFQVGQGLRQELSLLYSLRQEKFDLVIDLRAGDRGAYTAFCSGAPMRAALYYENLNWRNKFFTHLVIPPPVPPREERMYGAAEQSLLVIRGLGMKEETTIPRIYVADETKKKIAALLEQKKIDTGKGWVSINPFSRWQYKEWGLDKWRQLALFIWRQYGMPLIVIGSSAEKKRTEEFITGAQSPVYNFAGLVSLAELPALLQKSRLHIGVDSAGPHIAAAVGTPTLSIYGPSDWRDWAPTGEKSKVVFSDMPCSPCYQKGCGGSGQSLCLDKLDVRQVQEAVEKILG